jgi:hypothetical protein
MSEESLKHVNRRLIEEERARHTRIRTAALQDFPQTGRTPLPPAYSDNPAS